MSSSSPEQSGKRFRLPLLLGMGVIALHALLAAAVSIEGPKRGIQADNIYYLPFIAMNVAFWSVLMLLGAFALLEEGKGRVVVWFLLLLLTSASLAPLAERLLPTTPPAIRHPVHADLPLRMILPPESLYRQYHTLTQEIRFRHFPQDLAHHLRETQAGRLMANLRVLVPGGGDVSLYANIVGTPLPPGLNIGRNQGHFQFRLPAERIGDLLANKVIRVRMVSKEPLQRLFIRDMAPATSRNDRLIVPGGGAYPLPRDGLFHAVFAFETPTADPVALFY